MMAQRPPRTKPVQKRSTGQSTMGHVCAGPSWLGPHRWSCSRSRASTPAEGSGKCSMETEQWHLVSPKNFAPIQAKTGAR